MKIMNRRLPRISPPLAKRWFTNAMGSVPRQSAGVPALGCMLALLAASNELRPALARLMGAERFSEAQLATLVALQSIDPVASTSAFLSDQAGIGAAHLTLVIDSLVAHDLVEESPDQSDQHQRSIRLTKRGRDVTVVTVHRFLEAVDQLLQGLSPTECAVLERACRRLAHRARPLSG